MLAPSAVACIISSNGSPPVSMARRIASAAAFRNRAFLSVLVSMMHLKVGPLSLVVPYRICATHRSQRDRFPHRDDDHDRGGQDRQLQRRQAAGEPRQYAERYNAGAMRELQKAA